MSSKTIGALVLVLCGACAATVLADSSTNCRHDSGGHLICVKREREPDTRRERKFTTTCRTDSGGHQVCRERCN